MLTVSLPDDELARSLRRSGRPSQRTGFRTRRGWMRFARRWGSLRLPYSQPRSRRGRRRVRARSGRGANRDLPGARLSGNGANCVPAFCEQSADERAMNEVRERKFGVVHEQGGEGCVEGFREMAGAVFAGFAIGTGPLRQPPPSFRFGAVLRRYWRRFPTVAPAGRKVRPGGTLLGREER